MSAAESVDGVVVDDEPGTALARVVPSPSLAVTPQVEAAELVKRLDVIREAMNNAMQEGVDYGKVPGVSKPTLLKPGSEKLGVLFQLDIQPEQELIWGPGEHLTVVSRATVYHAPTGSRLGKGEGLCSTREKKYAKRQAQRVCPACGVAAIIKGKSEYGGGWVCFKKKDGCGAKYSDGDATIESQTVGEVENPDLPDVWNTVIKMAEKRARVDAVLAVTGASALFTQDAEDVGGDSQPDRSPPQPAATQKPIDTERANEIALLVHEAMQGEHVTAPQLSEILTGAGADVEVINRGTIAALTADQADRVEIALRERIPAEATA